MRLNIGANPLLRGGQTWRTDELDLHGLEPEIDDMTVRID